MVSKYLREADEHRFNRVLETGNPPGYTPRAAITTDGMRFLNDIFAKRQELGIPDELLIPLTMRASGGESLPRLRDQKKAVPGAGTARQERARRGLEPATTGSTVLRNEPSQKQYFQGLYARNRAFRTVPGFPHFS